MHKVCIGWMYPNLLNLHGERGSVQALVAVGESLGLDMEVKRIERPSDPIPFDELDMMIFLPGEISMFPSLLTALQAQRSGLDAYLENGGYLLALGTTGLLFGEEITREDGSIITGMGYLDMTAKERKYVWGDDLHLRLNGTKQELIGSQIQMADVVAAQPLAQTIYGRGNNGSGAEGARWNNLIYTNCLGPLFVKNPWFAEDILKDICQEELVSVQQSKLSQIAQESFDSTLRFIESKPKQA